MVSVRYVICAIIVAILGGCAAHPLPENYERYGTVEIVEHIRCEARRSIQDNAIFFLRREGNGELADQLDADRAQFERFKTSRLRTQAEKDFYNRYIKSAIAMAFTFDITEENTASTQLDFMKVISGGTFSLGAMASSDLKREASREFIVTDTFQGLLDDRRVCNPEVDPPPRAPNLVYPVTGSVGLSEVIQTFVRLNEDGILFKSDDDKAPVFADTLDFTTTFSGSLSPKVTLNPINSRRIQLSDASLMAEATRTDANKVIVSLSLDPKHKDRTIATGIVGAPFSGSPNVVGSVFARRNLSESQVRAVQAITQTRIDTFFDRFSQVVVPR